MSLNYKNITINIALIAFSLIITFAVVEGFLRLSGYAETDSTKSQREIILQPSSNPNLKYELVPNSKGYAWGTDVQINGDGYRGYQGQPGKFDGLRIITIGDSITFGNKLPNSDTYASQLSQQLKQESQNYEVLNFGVGGYDVLQNVSLLEHKGLKYAPNLVVLGFCLNDIGIASLNSEYIERSKKQQSNALSFLRTAQFITDKIEKLRISQWLKNKNQIETFKLDYQGQIANIDANDTELNQLMRSASERYPLVWYQDKHRIGRLRYSLEQLSILSKKHHFNVAVVIFPWLDGDKNNYPYHIAHQIVSSEANRVGFDVLDPTQQFIQQGMTNLRISDKDWVHPNKTGHQIVANQLAQYIQQKWPQARPSSSISTETH